MSAAMLLILTHSADATADYLCLSLQKAEIAFLRINSDAVIGKIRLFSRDGSTRLIIGSRTIVAGDISNVWLRRPRTLSTELAADPAERRNLILEWSEALEGFLAQIPLEKWINHPSANVGASHKLEQLHRASQFGLNIPKTLMTQDSADLLNFWKECQGQVIVKPLASGFLERTASDEDSHIYTNAVKLEHLDGQALVNCPTLFQATIDKTLDVRVTVLDGEIEAVSMKAVESDGIQRLDIRRNNMSDVAYGQITVPSKIKDILIPYLNSYKLRFAAVDMAVDRKGEWIFFEVNPNGQWAWLDLVGVADIGGMFIRRLRT